jgi:hypothetical protein
MVSNLISAMIGLPQRALVDVTPNYRARAATRRAFFFVPDAGGQPGLATLCVKVIFIHTRHA